MPKTPRFPLHPSQDPFEETGESEFSIADTGRFSWGKKKNVLGGYNPYDTGVYSGSTPTKKKGAKDLRKLSEWIKAKKLAEAAKAEEDRLAATRPNDDEMP
jgi:hypothetical protein